MHWTQKEKSKKEMYIHFEWIYLRVQGINNYSRYFFMISFSFNMVLSLLSEKPYKTSQPRVGKYESVSCVSRENDPNKCFPQLPEDVCGLLLESLPTAPWLLLFSVRTEYVLDEEFEGQSLINLLEPNMEYWCHHNNEILPQGRITWWKPKVPTILKIL